MACDTDRCPLCKRKLMMTTGVPTCPDCGYIDPYGTRNQNQAQNQNQNQNMVYYSAVPQNTSKKSNTGMVVGVIVGIFTVLMVAVCGLISALVVFYQSNKEQGETIADGRYGHDSQSNSQAVVRGGSEDSHSDFPESELLVELVEYIFQKELDQITCEEIESIVYLNFYDSDILNCLVVEYELADGTFGSCVPYNHYLNVRDLNCFSGLEWLGMEESVDMWTDWSNLTNLYGLSCDASLSDIAKAMDASQLIWLRAEAGTFDNGLQSAKEYENLQYLELDANSFTESLEGISDLASLREFILTDADNIGDYEELYSMTQLETLSIDSKGLRDIGFVREMENLTRLELTGTSVKKLDALEECADTLKVLRLENNYSVEDYSAVLSCTGLEQLALYISYSFDEPMQVPDLSAMTELKVLELGNYDRFDNLSKLTGLEELTISDVYTGDGTALESLQNLRVLRLLDMSLEKGFVNTIPSLSKLEVLDMTDSFVWADIAPVFGAPNLQEVYLNEVDAGLDMRNMSVCESLEVLDMTGIRLRRLKEDGSWDYQADRNDSQIALQDVEDFFACFPNLNELYIPGHELEDVAFLTDKQCLYYLDISDNYITDLSPLAGLPDLKVVLCRRNPLHNRDGLDNVVLIED